MKHLFDAAMVEDVKQRARAPEAGERAAVGHDDCRVMYKHLDHHLRQFGV